MHRVLNRTIGGREHCGRFAGLFFGERPERKAHRSLSTALWHIRRCLPDESALLNDAHTVQFDPQRDLWLDVEAFEKHAVRQDAASLQVAVALYRGDFLDGFFDDWIVTERYRQTLQEELDARPMDETTRLCQEILGGVLQPALQRKSPGLRLTQQGLWGAAPWMDLCPSGW